MNTATTNHVNEVINNVMHMDGVNKEKMQMMVDEIIKMAHTNVDIWNCHHECESKKLPYLDDCICQIAEKYGIAVNQNNQEKIYNNSVTNLVKPMTIMSLFLTVIFIIISFFVTDNIIFCICFSAYFGVLTLFFGSYFLVGKFKKK
ncbi:MAG: hypothetical protein [Wendovervirus sonii]|uniref:Uncharacterized protein n=1 Tax=phage Lak_Megaphage_Sonny TaxID=3109229 RepID=A0ABZ0Z323_9CAUD|nr:MAG: hypothetical protein [phage Lak_Megaphage_Sonny]